MRRAVEEIRELARYARQQSLFEWLVAYLAGAGMLWLGIWLLGEHLGWRPAVARLGAIALGLGLLPVLVVAWYRDVDYEPARTQRELLWFAAAALVVGVGLWLLAPRIAPPSIDQLTTITTRPPALTRPTVAVMPFSSRSEADADAYLAAGIHDDLMHRLRGITTLEVATHGAVLSLRADASPREVADALQVRYVLQGTVRRSDARIRVGVTLWEGAGGQRLWTQDFDRKESDLLVLQVEIAERVARTVVRELNEVELKRLRRNPTDDPAAYSAFLEGQHHLRAATRDAREAAIRSFRRAVLLDAKYARAWAGLADAYNFRADLYLPQEVWPVSSALAERAMALDPTLAEVHATRARILAYHERDLAQADQVFRRALELGAVCGDESRVCESYFSVLNLMGYSDAAIEVTRALVAQRSRDPSAFRRLALAYLYAGRYADAGEALDRARSLLGEGTPASRADLMALSAMVRAFDGQAPPAQLLGREALLLAPMEPVVLVNAGVALGAAGDLEGARAALALFDRLAGHGLAAPRTYRAAISVRLGDADEVFRLLDEAHANGEAVLLEVLNEPAFDPVRGDPRLHALARRMGTERFLRREGR